MRFRTRFLLFSGVMAACVCLTACVASESSRYERTLSSRVQSTQQSRGDVSIAFGLDEQKQPPTAVAEVPTDR